MDTDAGTTERNGPEDHAIGTGKDQPEHDGAPPAAGSTSKVLNAIAYLWLPVAVGLTWFYNLEITHETRTLVLVGVVVATLCGGLITLALLGRKYQTVARMTAGIVLVITTVLVGILPVILLGAPERVLVLKLGAIVILSLIPGMLFIQFVALKGETLRDEYVMNLHRLAVDIPENLPEPSWKQPPQVEQAERNLYLRKFDALYGSAIMRPDGQVIRRPGGVNLLPVVLCTVLLAVGWALFLQPEPLGASSLRIGDFTLSGRPSLPGDALRFGFLGAYLFIIQMLIRRYFQDDLKTAAYTSASARIVTVILLVTAVHQVWPSDLSNTQEFAVAFIIGVFPQVGLRALQKLIALPMRLLIPSLDPPFPLSDLDGLDMWYEARLLEEGIEDMQNLATANLVDVMLRTRVPVERLVDWIDQAQLYLRVGKERRKDAQGHELPSDREVLRRLGIRTATDLEDAFSPALRRDRNGQLQAEPPDVSAAFETRLLNSLGGQSDTLPSVTMSILKTLSREPNLYHVRKWKTFAWDVEQARKISRTQASGARTQPPQGRSRVAAPPIPVP